MQGRLLPKYRGRYQAHPVACWQKEFGIAKAMNLACIEFIFDFDEWEKNPLITDDGRKEIVSVSEVTGVAVKSICADYFMERPFHQSSERNVMENICMFERLIFAAREIGVRNIVLPCVDRSSLRECKDFTFFVEAALSLERQAEAAEVNIALETDLSPIEFAELLEKLDSSVFSVNYDTGNSASLGYDVEEEFAAYGGLISDIHIKDRLRGGPSVLLGTGATDFDKFFKCLSRYNYRGPLIMQAYRDNEGIGVFKKQLSWIKEKMAKIRNEDG